MKLFHAVFSGKWKIRPKLHVAISENKWRIMIEVPPPPVLCNHFSLSDRLWFDELISLWVSVQNLPSWEVVSSLICWLDCWVSSTTLLFVAGWVEKWVVTCLVKPARSRQFCWPVLNTKCLETTSVWFGSQLWTKNQIAAVGFTLISCVLICSGYLSNQT